MMKKITLSCILAMQGLFAYNIADSFRYPVSDSDGIYNHSRGHGWFVAQDFQDCRKGPVPKGIAPCRHLGEDWNYFDGSKITDANRDIVSIGNGYVVASGVRRGFAGYVIVKHYLDYVDSSNYVLSIYAHLQTYNLPKVGTYLAKGQFIAKTASEEEMNKWTSFEPHLHFEIRKSKSITGLDDTFLNDGYDYSNGRYYDPTDVVISNYDTHTINNSGDWNSEPGFIEHFVSNAGNKGIFDGAGSLVSPTESRAGGKFDIDMMQPHSPNNSTVVFQWLYDKNNCSHIDLFTKPQDGDLDVRIKVKGWSQHLVQEAFDVTLHEYGKNASNGISINRPANAGWITLAVTSRKPISKRTQIIALCRDDSNPFEVGNRVERKPSLVDVTTDYYWTGTGSIISWIKNRYGVGVTGDYVITYNAHKSFSTFQWYTSDKCKKISIEATDGTYSNVNEVKIKGWSAKDWSNNRCTSLPCVIDAPSLNNYFIIKVKSNANAIESGELHAQCVE